MASPSPYLIVVKGTSMIVSPALLLLSVLLQAPSEPPMKMGLWETTLNVTMTTPDGSARTMTHVLRSCTTRDTWQAHLGPTSAEACPKTHEVWTKDSYSFDIACPGQPKDASVSVHFTTMEEQHIVVDTYRTPSGDPVKQHLDGMSHWTGADCGDVSPDRPVPVR